MSFFRKKEEDLPVEIPDLTPPQFSMYGSDIGSPRNEQEATLFQKEEERLVELISYVNLRLASIMDSGANISFIGKGVVYPKHGDQKMEGYIVRSIEQPEGNPFIYVVSRKAVARFPEGSLEKIMFVSPREFSVRRYHDKFFKSEDAKSI